jgi:hypothetical protein
MSVFGIETENNLGVRIFMLQTLERLKNPNLIINPFNGLIKLVNCNDKQLTYIVKITPVYPPFWLFGVLIGVIISAYKGTVLTYWNIATCFFLFFGLFWSKYFIYIVMRIALYKHGYKGKAKLISNSRLLCTMIETII